MFSSFKGNDKPEELFRHFTTALRDKDNLQEFLVVRINDVQKNEVREFCTLGCFFRHALHIEWKLDYDDLSDDLVIAKASLNNPRLFDFKNTDALNYLGMDLYSPEDLKQLEKEINFKKLAKEIASSGKWEKDFGEDDKLLHMYAHALFNEEISTGEDITATGNTLVFTP